MVPPGKEEKLMNDLELKGISHEIIIPDVQKLIELEKMAAPQKDEVNPRHAMTWDAYHPLEDMYSYLDYLEETYDFVTTEVIGQSYEQRDMRVISICRGGCGNKPAIWIDGGIHAREWISPATTLWTIDEVLSDEYMMDKLDWYFLPVVNPDGYTFTHEHTRLWRKTRSYHNSLLGWISINSTSKWCLCTTGCRG